MKKFLLFLIIISPLSSIHTMSKEKSIAELTIERLRAAAQAGEAQAQYQLGLCYAEGREVERSLEQAKIWYKKAADQKHVQAMYRLAELLDPDNKGTIEEALILAREAGLHETLKAYDVLNITNRGPARMKFVKMIYNWLVMDLSACESIQAIRDMHFKILEELLEGGKILMDVALQWKCLKSSTWEISDEVKEINNEVGPIAAYLAGVLCYELCRHTNGIDAYDPNTQNRAISFFRIP